MYEGGLLVPACAVWPGVIPARTSTSVRCSTIDYFPTIANLTGYKFATKDKRPIDGMDLMPVILGKVEKRSTSLFFGYRRLHGDIDGQAIISGDFKLLREAKPNGRIRLYDLANDPYEKHGLAETQPERLRELMQRMQAIDQECQLSRDGADYRY